MSDFGEFHDGTFRIQGRQTSAKIWGYLTKLTNPVPAGAGLRGKPLKFAKGSDVPLKSSGDDVSGSGFPWIGRIQGSEA